MMAIVQRAKCYSSYDADSRLSTRDQLYPTGTLEKGVTATQPR
jgi:hypothetical protein